MPSPCKVFQIIGKTIYSKKLKLLVALNLFPPQILNCQLFVIFDVAMATANYT